MVKTWKTEPASAKSFENTLVDFYQQYNKAINERNFDFVATIIADEVKLNGQPSRSQDI